MGELPLEAEESPRMPDFDDSASTAASKNSVFHAWSCNGAPVYLRTVEGFILVRSWGRIWQFY